MKKLYSRSTSGQFQDSFQNMFPELTDCEEEGMVVKNVTFVTTEACNLACKYCYEQHKTTRTMSVETAKAAIDALFDKEKVNGYITDYNQCIIIEFIGGEPFLNMEVINFVSEYLLFKAAELNHPWYKYHMFSVTSNGTLFHTKPVQEWINKYRSRLSVSITIDGDKELHDSCRVFHDGSGSYDIVVKAMKDAIENYGLNGTKVTFAPENIDKINTAIPHLFDLGLTEIHANCVFEDVWKPDHAITFYKELTTLADYIIDNNIYENAYCSIFDENIGTPIDRADDKNWCGGDGSMLAIGVDGRFFPCIRYMKYALSGPGRKEQPIGDANFGIESKTENAFLIELSGIKRSTQSTEECMNCKIAQGCAW